MKLMRAFGLFLAASVLASVASGCVLPFAIAVRDAADYALTAPVIAARQAAEGLGWAYADVRVVNGPGNGSVILWAEGLTPGIAGTWYGPVQAFDARGRPVIVDVTCREGGCRRLQDGLPPAQRRR